MMKPSEIPDPPDLAAERDRVSAAYLAFVTDFLEAKRAELGADLTQRLQDLAKTSLLAFSLRFRVCWPSSVDSGPYWDAYDAGSFILESLRGRWPYIGPEQRLQYLRNAESSMRDCATQLGRQLGAFAPQPMTLDTEPVAAREAMGA